MHALVPPQSWRLPCQTVALGSQGARRAGAVSPSAPTTPAPTPTPVPTPTPPIDEDIAPDKRPSAPDVELKAGVPVAVKVGEWRVTSVCGSPNIVTSLTARMMPSPDIFATPLYEERFPVQYTVTR